jgi:hypothetical protein
MDSTYVKCCNLCVDQYLERPKFLKALTLVKWLSLYNLKGYKKTKPKILPLVNFECSLWSWNHYFKKIFYLIHFVIMNIHNLNYLLNGVMHIHKITSKLTFFEIIFHICSWILMSNMPSNGKIYYNNIQLEKCED